MSDVNDIIIHLAKMKQDEEIQKMPQEVYNNVILLALHKMMGRQAGTAGMSFFYRTDAHYSNSTVNIYG